MTPYNPYPYEMIHYLEQSRIKGGSYFPDPADSLVLDPLEMGQRQSEMIIPSHSDRIESDDVSLKDETGSDVQLLLGQSALDALVDNVDNPTLDDPLAQLCFQRKQFLGSCVEELLSQIHERELLTEEHLRCIDKESCQMKERLFRIDDWQEGVSPNIDKTRSHIQRELLGMEREKRMEEVACWRDIIRLKTELREQLQEWAQAKRKVDLLSQ